MKRRQSIALALIVLFFSGCAQHAARGKTVTFTVIPLDFRDETITISVDGGTVHRSYIVRSDPSSGMSETFRFGAAESFLLVFDSETTHIEEKIGMKTVDTTILVPTRSDRFWIQDSDEPLLLD